MDSVCIRTRQSLGSQLREALDDMRGRGSVRSWDLTAEPGRIRYAIVDHFGREESLTPGEAMDWLNGYGYAIRYGKS
jgi:hypothetical protein